MGWIKAKDAGWGTRVTINVGIMGIKVYMGLWVEEKGIRNGPNGENRRVQRVGPWESGHWRTWA